MAPDKIGNGQSPSQKKKDESRISAERNVDERILPINNCRKHRNLPIIIEPCTEICGEHHM